jgi:hypothetical protein
MHCTYVRMIGNTGTMVSLYKDWQLHSLKRCMLRRLNNDINSLMPWLLYPMERDPVSTEKGAGLALSNGINNLQKIKLK